MAPQSKEESAGFDKTTIPSVETVTIDLDQDGRFYEAWKEAFPSPSPLYTYNVKDDPATAAKVVNDAFAFVVQWLPRDLIAKLAAFPFDPNAPSALLIRGLPIGHDIPPTPIKKNLFGSTDNQKDNQKTTLLPVAETVLLGISRLLGQPHTPMFWNGERGGLIRDIVSAAENPGDLPMHRDFPRQPAVTPPPEPHHLILFCVRGDEDGKTIVADSSKLLPELPEADVELLRRYKIQIQRDIQGKVQNIGQPFFCIEDDATTHGHTVVTLFEFAGSTAVGVAVSEKDQQADNSDDKLVEAAAAYKRLAQTAFDRGERVHSRPGEMLIMNNCRCVHGRTPHYPKLNGTDRWLIKTYVSNRLWDLPGAGQGGAVQFPNMNPYPETKPFGS